MISEGADESCEKTTKNEPQAYEVLPSMEQIDEKPNGLEDMSDASVSDILSPIYGFAPNDEHTMRHVNRILDLRTYLRYRCDPRSIWYPEQPLSFRKRNYSAVEGMEVDNESIADDRNRSTTSQRVPKRCRRK